MRPFTIIYLFFTLIVLLVLAIMAFVGYVFYKHSAAAAKVEIEIKSGGGAKHDSVVPVTPTPLPKDPSVIGQLAQQKTRGEPPAFQQVGTLSDSEGKRILPLFGRPTYIGSDKWEYYTSSEGFHMMRLGVRNANRDCGDEYGCAQIYDGDSVEVPTYKQTLKATIYKYDSPRYTPSI